MATMKVKSIIMLLAGCWLFGFGLRLVWMQFNMPVVFNPNEIEWIANWIIDIAPAFILSLCLIYFAIRSIVELHRRRRKILH